MFNRERTKEIFGYDIDVTKRRRTAKEIAEAPKVDKKSQLKVIDNCPLCNKEKQVKLKQSLKNKLCSKCFHNSEEMLKIKHNNHHIPTQETRQKMKENHWSKNGGISAFKDKKHTKETKQILREKHVKQFAEYNQETINEFKKKASCKLRSINIPESEFNGFISTENQRARGLSEYKEWEKAIFEKYHNKCDICFSSIKLTAHHLYNFSSHLDKRHDISNGVLLCDNCHNLFHNKYSRRNNTPEQYLEFKAFLTPSKPILYIVTGIPGSGKSWVCNQLKDKFNYVSYDESPKITHLDQLRNPKDPTKPLLYDPNIKISTIFTRYSDEFDIRLLVILGDFLKIKQQLVNRGGKITKTTYKRWKVMKARRKKYGIFDGDSNDVLRYLKNVDASISV
jgi:hypothetical protein